MKKILIKKVYGFLVLGLLSIPHTGLMASSTPALTPNQTAAVMGIITNFILDDDNAGIANSAYVDVRDYGAIVNDDIDDYAAISSAVAEINHLGGGTLLFHEGTYTIKGHRIDDQNNSLKN